MDARPRVAVVGGGISGLATAYFLNTLDERQRPDVILIEADGRLGGKVRTHPVAGLPVDTGPDAFLARAAKLRELIDSLGLAEAVTAPVSGGSYVWSRDKLRPLPPGTMFGVPEKLVPLLRSGLLSPLGAARAGFDMIMPSRVLPADPSVADLTRPRFGAEVYDRLVEPLLGGVHAGRAHVLSAHSTVPELTAIARRSRSLYLGLRRSRANRPASSGPALVGLSGGLSRLTDALAAWLDPVIELRRNTEVTGLDRVVDGYRLLLRDGSSVRADAAVLATPAYVTSDLVGHLVPRTADALAEIPYVDVASVILGYDPAVVGRPLDGGGFLVPPVDGRLVVGCTWLTSKWDYLTGSPTVLIRCLVGRYGDRRFLSMDDPALVKAVHDEISGVLDLAAPPRKSHVQRWPRAMPQYTVGHGDRLSRIDAGMAQVPGLVLTGAAYRGVGLAGCVTQAADAARAVLRHLADGPTRQSRLPVYPERRPVAGGPGNGVAASGNGVAASGNGVASGEPGVRSGNGAGESSTAAARGGAGAGPDDEPDTVSF